MSNGIGVAYLPLAAYEDIEVDLYKLLKKSFPSAVIHEGIESGRIQFCENPVREVVWRKEIYDKPTYELDIEYFDDSNDDNFESTLMLWDLKKWRYEVDLRYKEMKIFISVLSNYFRIVEMGVSDFETCGIFDLSINLEQYFRNTHYVDYKYSELKEIFDISNTTYCWFFALNKYKLPITMLPVISELGDFEDLGNAWIVRTNDSILGPGNTLINHWWADLDFLKKFHRFLKNPPFLLPK